MTSLPEANAPKRPSERAIAFAISIVHSKPEELTVREYIRLLRQHVAKGRRENALSAVYRHLDRSSFWHAEYERVRDALQTAEHESVGLRKEVDGLKARLESTQTTTIHVKKKRKKVDEDVVLVPRSPKRSERDVSPVRADGGGRGVERGEEFEFVGVGEIGDILMRSLYQMHANMKSARRTEPRELAHHLIRAASALPQVMREAVKLQMKSASEDVAILKSTTTAGGRTMLSLIVGFNRLDHLTDGAEVQGHVTYAYVQMFANSLNIIEEASAAELNKTGKVTPASATKGVSLDKSKAKVKRPKPVNIRDKSTLRAVSNFLCGVIDFLDPKIDSHQALFEGFAYSVLNKLGARLYVAVFGHARGATIENEIDFSNRPDKIEYSAAPASTQLEDITVRQVKLEAPYLVHLLTHIMNAAPAHLGAIISSKTGRPKQANNRGSMKGALAISAKERLQRTLVNCVFGTEGVDEDDPFIDCLKTPVASGQGLPMPKVKEAEVLEWFQQEVWRLLGWEILAKESG